MSIFYVFAKSCSVLTVYFTVAFFLSLAIIFFHMTYDFIFFIRSLSITHTTHSLSFSHSIHVFIEIKLTVLQYVGLKLRIWHFSCGCCNFREATINFHFHHLSELLLLQTSHTDRQTDKEKDRQNFRAFKGILHR